MSTHLDATLATIDAVLPQTLEPRYREKPLVYLAGPYTHPDPVKNTHKVITLADRIMAEGLVVPVVPHMNLLWHLVRPHTEKYWYEYDFHLLARCDALLRMPGASKGSDGEVEFARAHDIPVFFSEKALNQWAVGIEQPALGDGSSQWPGWNHQRTAS